MATAQGPQLESILVEAEFLTRPRPMPSAPLRERLRSSSALRRLAPASVIVAAAQSRGRALWRSDPATRQYAIAAMEAIVAGTARADQAEQLARQCLVEQAVLEELFWMPWRMPSIDRASANHAQAAFSSGRGVLISSCHLGAIGLRLWPLSAPERRIYTTAAQWYFEEPNSDYLGRRLARWWRQIARRNELVIPASGSFALLAQLLERGDAVQVYFDMPGGTRTQFLGKPVMLSSGSARLALATDALILPVTIRREGVGCRTEVCAPLDPRSHPDLEELQHALAGVHESLILEQPQALEDPNRPGAWEGLASAAEWANPREARQLR